MEVDFMYKVGDEVLVKARVDDVDENASDGMEVRVKIIGCCPQWIKEGEIASKTYTQGLADAWELANRLYAFEPDEREKMLGYQSMKAILEDLTPEYVMDKIEAYEKEKEIKVGDEVAHGCDGCEIKFYVTYLTQNQIKGFSKDGDTHYFVFPNPYIKRTGKHIDIESLLRQIGE